jgi:hypothetical protein
MPPSWTTPIDNYCERIGQGFWAEPLNAVTNAGFLVAAALALVEWRKAGGKDHASLWLIAVTAVVGTGSFLFHTFANRWSMIADVAPITAFIYGYFLFALRRFFGLGWFIAAALTLLFFAASWAFGGLFPAGALNGSIDYLPALFALVALGLMPSPARPWLLAGSLVFLVSLAFRTVDQTVCAWLPVGTHYAWHTLNAVLLFILLDAAIRHGRVAKSPANT